MNNPTQVTQQFTNEFAPDDFYRAFAIAILNWQYVEHNLFRLYFKVNPSPDLIAVSTEYYKTRMFSRKMTLTKEAVENYSLDVGIKAQWSGLVDEIEQASEHRNALAHLTAVCKFHDDNSLELVLAPGIYVPKTLIQKRQTIDAAECERLAFLFEEISEKIEALTNSF